jgi:hypothetical protein
MPALAARVMASYLDMLMANDEPPDDQAHRRTVARRIASDLREDEALVRRILAEVVALLSDPNRFSDHPVTDKQRLAAAAVAETVSRRGVTATPEDVDAVMTALFRLTGDVEPPTEPFERSSLVGQVADEAGRAIEMVSLIFDEVEQPIE